MWYRGHFNSGQVIDKELLYTTEKVHFPQTYEENSIWYIIVLFHVLLCCKNTKLHLVSHSNEHSTQKFLCSPSGSKNSETTCRILT